MNATYRRRRGTIDLDATLRRLGEFPEFWLADAGSHEQRTRWSQDELKAKGIVLRGHKSAIDELVLLAAEKRRCQLAAFDEFVRSLLAVRLPGRPNERSALRDFLIFTVLVLHQSSEANVREARKRTAKFFDLTCDTRFSHRQRPSLDQVKRAEERTIHRFKLLKRWGASEGLLGPLWQKSVTVLGFCLAEEAGMQLDADAFRYDAVALISACRTLDAAERLYRLEKAERAQADLPLVPRTVT